MNGPNISVWILFQNIGHSMGSGDAYQEEVPPDIIWKKKEKHT